SSASLPPSARVTSPPAGGITAGVTVPWQMAPHLCQPRKKWLTWAIWRPITATSTNGYHDIMISLLSYLFSFKFSFSFFFFFFIFLFSLFSFLFSFIFSFSFFFFFFTFRSHFACAY